MPPTMSGRRAGARVASSGSGGTPPARLCSRCSPCSPHLVGVQAKHGQAVAPLVAPQPAAHLQRIPAGRPWAGARRCRRELGGRLGMELRTPWRAGLEAGEHVQRRSRVLSRNHSRAGQALPERQRVRRRHRRRCRRRGRWGMPRQHGADRTCSRRPSRGCWWEGGRGPQTGSGISRRLGRAPGPIRGPGRGSRWRARPGRGAAAAAGPARGDLPPGRARGWWRRAACCQGAGGGAGACRRRGASDSGSLLLISESSWQHRTLFMSLIKLQTAGSAQCATVGECAAPGSIAWHALLGHLGFRPPARLPGGQVGLQRIPG